MSPQTMAMSAARVRLLWVFYQWEDGVAEKPDDGDFASDFKTGEDRGTVTPTSEKSQRSARVSRESNLASRT